MKSFRQYLLESRSNHVFRLDHKPVEQFDPKPYVMDRHGNSQRGDMPLEGHKPFSGVYAGSNVGLIAPYALQREGNTSKVPWVAVYKPNTKPIVFVHHEDIIQNHSPVFLSTFDGKHFSPRRKVVERLHGAAAKDIGDDEHIALKSVSPITQRKITDIPAFLDTHMDLRVIPSIKSGGGRDHEKMAKIATHFSGMSADGVSVIRNG